MGYLTNFIVYTLAMVGVFVVAMLVFKSSTGCGIKKQSKTLKIVDSMNIAPRKTLYIVSAGEEKFLIASDADRTNLISKLNSEEKGAELSFKDTLRNEYKPKKENYMDKASLGIYKTQEKPYDSVMKNLAERIRQ
ncbi:MAG: hypothetical protein E7Z89_07350 [Cyanobacteria bacterium SIG28]|nr:hypothetical protein [Cyanobacteria bacterium SIG28]